MSRELFNIVDSRMYLQNNQLLQQTYPMPSTVNHVLPNLENCYSQSDWSAGSVSSISDSNQCGGERMVDWLRQELNASRVHGLDWLDIRDWTFRVLWKHISSREWNETDGHIFKVSVFKYSKLKI